MIQILFIRVLLFFMPFVLYAGYLRFIKGVEADDPRYWTVKRLTWLVIVSIVIVGTSFFWLASKAPQGGDYEPAHMEDGKLVPGKIDRNDDPR